MRYSQNFSQGNPRNFITVCFNQHNLKYKQKNKLPQPAPILHKISIRLSAAVHCNIMKSAPLFFKSLILYGCFGKYKLNVPFETISDVLFTFYNVPRKICHSDSTLFSIVSICKYHLFMNDFYSTVLARK